ncbi:MAG TPA: BON domain-containing protein [Steroidobacteraceae bacterium]|nr:BON domain-containing protein [Steroidobacteraceae bacterium]
MRSRSLAVLITSAVLAAAAGCSSTPSSGPAETTAAKAGRVVDDSVITAKVKAALIQDPVTKAHEISVETFHGTVQLSGFVDSAESKARASQVAQNVEGVRDVKNSLQLQSANQ